MCIIVAKKRQVALPSLETLKECEKSNKDGIGLAMTFREGVYISKGFTDAEALHTWATKYVGIDDICIMHFRFATTGKVSAENCHPYPITDNAQLIHSCQLFTDSAIAHNGCFGKFSGKKDDDFSDSALFTMEILALPEIKQNLLTKGVSKLLESYISPSRVAMIYNNELITYGNFIEDGGLLYSNGQYKKYVQQVFNRWHEGEEWDYKQQKWVKKEDKKPTVAAGERTVYSGGKTYRYSKAKDMVCDFCRRKVEALYGEFYDKEAQTIVYSCKACHKAFRDGLVYCECCGNFYGEKKVNVIGGVSCCVKCEKDMQEALASVGKKQEELKIVAEIKNLCCICQEREGFGQNCICDTCRDAYGADLYY